ncbi:hypothetical protein HX882_14145 [Pseudomonas gingeri]|uniref:Uncharacterized protein n=1 Tax=Pseudomonas gingeri TaxID=117681 RepID=A0A7Y8C3B3_9PSED|nr:hypothetical protein [Pseudomonas gingeri]NWB97036.1 hypothetical protein [Pseudomonas gingeri]
MCEAAFQIIYMLFVLRKAKRVAFVEFCIKYTGEQAGFLEDHLRNESLMYEQLFSSKCKGYVLDFFERLMAEMRGLKYEDSNGILEALEFFQEVGAIALWKYNCNLDPKIDSFVRGFDRLDVGEERKRLYFLAQAS